jgi:hypothetical protein
VPNIFLLLACSIKLPLELWSCNTVPGKDLGKLQCNCAFYNIGLAFKAALYRKTNAIKGTVHRFWLRVVSLDRPFLKVPKREIFDGTDCPDFYTMKSLRVGDFGVKIKNIYTNI